LVACTDQRKRELMLSERLLVRHRSDAKPNHCSNQCSDAA